VVLNVTVSAASAASAFGNSPSPLKAEKEVGVVVDELLSAKLVSGRRERYVKGLGLYLRQFIKGREMEAITQFTVTHIEAWFLMRNEIGSTRASNIGRLSALFSFAKRRGYVNENPCDRLEKMMIDFKPPIIFTVDQCKKMLVFARENTPRFIPWLTLALFGGIRPSECDALKWPDVNLETGMVTVSAAASKVRRRRIVTLCPAAIAWLKLGGDLPLPPITRRRAVRKLRDFLELKNWPQDVLRHTAASYQIAHTGDLQRTALELGNSPSILLRHYRELVSIEEARRFYELNP